MLLPFLSDVFFIHKETWLFFQGELKDLALSCSIEDMIEPLFLSISGEVKGLYVTYSVPCDSGVARYIKGLPLKWTKIASFQSKNTIERGKKLLIYVNFIPLPAVGSKDSKMCWDNSLKVLYVKKRYGVYTIAKFSFFVSPKEDWRRALLHSHPLFSWNKLN